MRDHDRDTISLQQRQEMIRQELDRVHRAAQRVAGEQNGAGVEVDDLVQVGTLALIEAVDDWRAKPPPRPDYGAAIARRIYRAMRKHVREVGYERERLCSLEEMTHCPAPARFDPVHTLYRCERTRTIVQVLAVLSPRQRLAMALWAELVDGRPWTSAKIGDLLGVSTTRGAQLVSSARERLKHPLHRRKLRDYLEQ